MKNYIFDTLTLHLIDASYRDLDFHIQMLLKLALDNVEALLFGYHMIQPVNSQKNIYCKKKETVLNKVK